MLNNKISKAVRLAIAFGAVTATAFSATAAENNEIEKIEITGSSIKGTDLAGALPVNVLSEEDIKATGVTSVPDLVAQIPSMQGFVTPVSSVGGSGGGTATAALRGLDSSYTLVLLNGRRIAPFGSSNTVDLNTIPLAAIERVEVLSDGASALYGSDAIAGVINFILKDEVDRTTVSARIESPEESGGGSKNFSITTGFGDFDQDGFSVVASLSHDSVDMLRSTDREFAKTGFLEFTHNERPYYRVNGSSNAIPGNAQVVLGTRNADGTLPDDAVVRNYTPYYEKNGECAPNTALRVGNPRCEFDFTSTLEIYPESERTSLVVQADVAVTDDITGFSTFTYTDFAQTPRIAPEPTGFMRIGGDLSNEELRKHPLFVKHAAPYLTEEELSRVTEFRGQWRALPGGNRTTEWTAEAYNVMAGLEGTIADSIDFNTAFVYSTSERGENILGGYYDGDKFAEGLASGRMDIFLSVDEFAANEEAVQAIEDAQWREKETTTKTELISFDFRASQALFELPAGEVYVGYGADIRQNMYENIRSAANLTDKRLGDNGGDFDTHLERQSYGAFTEFQIPVLDDLNVNVALRYDSIGSIDDSINNVTAGETETDTTYKVSFRYNASDDLVVRGSIGTGFKVAALTSIARPFTPWGVTGGNYTCPLVDSNPLARYCPQGSTQYQYNISGNPDLKPEQSTQSTIGFVYAPSTDFSFELDYWKVEIEDMVQSPEQRYLMDQNNSPKFPDYFFLQENRSDPTLQQVALRNSPLNIGKTEISGIDWKLDLTNELSFGDLRTSVQGTYLLESTYTRPAVIPYEWTTSLGKYGEDEEVVFRNVINVQNTLTHGDFAHTVRFSYRSGWRDNAVNAVRGTIAAPDLDRDDNLQTDQIQYYVPSYVKTDYKLDYRGFEDTTITFGIKNLFDKEPPQSHGDPEGHLIGFEGRYYDVFLRTYYLDVSYSF